MNNQNGNYSQAYPANYSQAYPGNLTSPLTYHHHENDEVMQKIDQTGMMIGSMLTQEQYKQEELCHQVANVGQAVKDLTNIVETVTSDRKPRKSCVHKNIVLSQNKKMLLMYHFDDRTREVKELVLEGFSRIETSILRFEEEEIQDYVLIDFGERPPVIIPSNAKRMEVYRCFVEAGIHFNQTIRESDISKALHEFVIEILNNANNATVLSKKGGWSGRIFMDSDNFSILSRTCHEKLPILTKKLNRESPKESDAKRYICDIKKIYNENLKKILVVLPFMASIKTLLKAEGISFPYVVNIVIGKERTALEELTKRCQIFNRNNMDVHDLNIRKKQLGEELDCIKDEIFIGRAILDKKTSYEKEKILQIMQELMDVEKTGRYSIRRYNGNWQGLSLVLSDIPLASGEALTVFLNEEDLIHVQRDLADDFIGRIIYGFICFIERYFEDVKNYILKLRQRKSEIPGDLAMQIVFNLVRCYFEDLNLDISSELMIGQNENWADFISDLMETNEDWLVKLEDDFVQGLYKYAKTISFLEVERAKHYSQIRIFYDDEDIYISRAIFNRILSNLELNRHKAALLSQLAMKGILRESREGYTTRKIIGDRRIRVYRLNREKLQQNEYGDIVYIGKEEK